MRVIIRDKLAAMDGCSGAAQAEAMSTALEEALFSQHGEQLPSTCPGIVWVQRECAWHDRALPLLLGLQ